MARWIFNDPATTSYTFEVNPNQGGSPSIERNLSRVPTVSSEGIQVTFEGRRKPQEITFSGDIFTQEQYDAMTEWYQQKNQIQIVDDLDRIQWVVITKFEPKRKRSYHYQWRHTFDCSAIIVDWP